MATPMLAPIPAIAPRFPTRNAKGAEIKDGHVRESRWESDTNRRTYHVQFEKDGWGGRWDWKRYLANCNGTGRMLNDSWTLNAPIFGGPPPPPPTRE